MSGDPFANTTTVKNILQHIISPKIVSDGANGYVSKTDLVNVHNLIFEAGASNEDGSVGNPYTTQCGRTEFPDGEVMTVYHSRVTPTSIIIASCQSGFGIFVVSVVPGNGYFNITLSSGGGYAGWFIAKF
jgi:hypothetical protein